VVATPTFAARAHEFKEAFGEACIVEPCEGAALKEPAGVAVNEATGDVYVVDKGAGRVVRFSESGVFQSEFKGTSATGGGTLTSGSSTIESVLVETGAFEVGQEISASGLETGTTITAVGPNSESLEISKPATASELATLSAHQGFETAETIAVDNSCALRKVSDPGLEQKQCEEEDPSNGHVYVVDGGSVEQGHLVIDKYTSGGEYVGQITDGSGGRFSRVIEGVAVDPQGHVWIVQENRTLSRFSNAKANVFEALVELTGFSDFPLPGGFSVDSNGSFYLRHGDPSTSKIAKVSSSGALQIEELDPEFSSSVATEQTTDSSFVDNLTSIAVFDSEGTLLEHLGEENGEEHLSEGRGIGVNAASSSFYVADAGSDTVVVFGPAKPTTPKVEGEAFSQVSSNSASLAARINPRSEPSEQATSYRFQYGRCSSATSCQESGYEASAPIPDGQISPDFEVHSVSVEITGLQSNTTYHFKVTAENSNGKGEGEEVTFTTQGVGGEVVLPDNRGWELVSPPDKQGALIEPIAETGVVQAAATGDGVTYLANAPTEAQPQGYSNQVQVLSRRGPAAWSSRDIAISHPGAAGLTVGPGQEYKFFDPHLGLGAVQPFGEFNPALSEEASESTAYLHDLSDACGAHCFRPLVTGKAGFANVPEGTQFGEEEACKPRSGGLAEKIACGPEFLGASESLSQVVLRVSVTPESGASFLGGLYEWSGGSLSQVNVLPPPGEETALGASLGLEDKAARGAISADGARVMWSLPGANPSLYLRDMSIGQTVQLDAAETGCGSCESGGARFQIASADGSRVFFTDERKLSKGSGASAIEHQADLYECKITMSGGEPACALTDLTPPNGEEGAAVLGGVLGASGDGSYIYFVAKGVLSNTANARGQSAIRGLPNVYVSHSGMTSFIATLSGGDEHDWEEILAHQPTRVSSNGQWLELMSEASLTGYDNRDAATGKRTAEVYLYDATSGRLSCASCEPTGVRPIGVEYQKLVPPGGLVGGPRGIWPASALVGANVPGWPQVAVNSSRYQPRYLTDSGRLFFNTVGALLPQDANGTQDVYQYEPPGVGNCSETSDTFSARSGGCVGLISAGRSAQESAFLDASESGDDVFFLTSAVLSSLDTDTAFDVYDAHVCTSGSPCITFPDVQSPPCTTEASCKASPTPQPSIFGAPASATFQGPGNLTPVPPPPPKKAESKAQKLAKALKACRAKKSKHKRKVCERQARKKYGAKKKKSKAKGRGKK
jgi:NHL repeat